MSRVGNKPVIIPNDIECISNGDSYTFKGGKGESTILLTRVNHSLEVEQEQKKIVLSPVNKSKPAREFWGLQRALLQNALNGVKEGFSKKLELIGTGYRASVAGKYLVLYLGYSHEIFFLIPEGVKIDVEKQNTVTVQGIDKCLVNQTAAKIRSFRPPEPYKGKGVKYADEVIIKKEGKK